MVATDAKVVPCTMGSRRRSAEPSVWIRVATPHMKKLAFDDTDHLLGGQPSALASTSGTAMMPAYMLSTCCRPKAIMF